MVNTDPKLAEFIRASLAEGSSKEDIYKELLERGLTVDAIQDGFSSLDTGQENADTQKRTIRIIVTIGAILIGAGVFSFFAANWQVLTKVNKVAIILVSMLISYCSGWYLREKYHFQRTGEALILLGSIIYGAGIFLVGQMFNVSGNWPDGFILWMIGAIAMGFAAESYPLFYLAVPLGFISLIGHPFGIFTGSGYNYFLLTSPLLLLAAAIICFAAGWKVRKTMSPDLKEYY